MSIMESNPMTILSIPQNQIGKPSIILYIALLTPSICAIVCKPYKTYIKTMAVCIRPLFQRQMKNLWMRPFVVFEIFFEYDHPKRTGKHITNPAKGSAAKRIHMFLYDGTTRQ